METGEAVQNDKNENIRKNIVHNLRRFRKSQTRTLQNTKNGGELQKNVILGQKYAYYDNKTSRQDYYLEKQNKRR